MLFGQAQAQGEAGNMGVCLYPHQRQLKAGLACHPAWQMSRSCLHSGGRAPSCARLQRWGWQFQGPAHLGLGKFTG